MAYSPWQQGARAELASGSTRRLEGRDRPRASSERTQRQAPAGPRRSAGQPRALLLLLDGVSGFNPTVASFRNEGRGRRTGGAEPRPPARLFATLAGFAHPPADWREAATGSH